MAKIEIKNGMKARDSITGFEGVVTGTAQFLTGCDQVMLTPQASEAVSKRPESEWFDINRIVVLGDSVVELPGDKALRGRDEPLPSVR